MKHPGETFGAMQLRHALRSSIVMTELQHSRVQFRLVAALLAGSMVFGLVDPALILLATEESLIYRAAALTSMGPKAIAHVLLVLAVLLVPFLLVQCGVGCKRARGATQLACASLALSAVVWLFLAWRCVPLDVGYAPVVFARYGVGSILFALALAWSLNAEQVRILLERPQ